MTQRHHEIAPHFTLTNHLVGLDYVLANADQIEGMEASDQEAFQSTFLAAQDEFVRRLQAAGVPVTVRDTRGREIDGACGQLAAKG